MKVTSVKEALDKDTISDKDNIKVIEGKITKLFDPKKGGEGDRAWEFQDAVFSDGTGEIKLSFSKCSQDKSVVGKRVRIESVKNDKHGWLGVMVNDEGDYPRKLRIQPSAKLIFLDGAPSQQSESPKAVQAKPKKPPGEVLDDIVYLYTQCYAKASAAFIPILGEKPEEHIRQIATGIFIEACRTFNLQHDAIKAFNTKSYPPPPSDPNDWDVCVVPSGKNEGKNLKEISDEDLKAMFEFYDKKGSNTPFAECVYKAAEARGLINKPEPEQEAPVDDDMDAIPF